MPRLPAAVHRHRAKIIGAVVVVLLVAVVGPFVYTHYINEPAEKASVDDIQITTTTDHDSSAERSSTSASSSSSSGIDGTWTVQDNDKAFAGYRVKEVLFGQDTEAVGRTKDVTGTLTASGTTITAVDITVDMTSVTSDESRRDGQFTGRIMATDQFPTATFVLTRPIDLGSLPAEGDTMRAEATGDLTLRGVTRSVTIPLTAKRQGDTLVVQGLGAVSFDDFDIPDATFGPAKVGRTGQVELLLVFAR
jgi:polyisoprenoid-binding protein YceI